MYLRFKRLAHTTRVFRIQQCLDFLLCKRALLCLPSTLDSSAPIRHSLALPRIGSTHVPPRDKVVPIQLDASVVFTSSAFIKWCNRLGEIPPSLCTIYFSEREALELCPVAKPPYETTSLVCRLWRESSLFEEILDVMVNINSTVDNVHKAAFCLRTMPPPDILSVVFCEVVSRQQLLLGHVRNMSIGNSRCPLQWVRSADLQFLHPGIGKVRDSVLRTFEGTTLPRSTK